MKKDILYSFRRCPYAIRVRWALLICEIKVELREIDLKNKSLDFLNKSKTKTVPILIKINSETIEESLEIILWALSESKKENMKNIYLPYSKQKEIFKLINENDFQFKYHLDRFKYSSRYSSIDKDYHFSEACKFINKLNEILINKKFFFGESQTMADWCIWPFIRQFKIACESQKKTNYFEDPIKEWLGNFENHQHFSKLMHKYDVWEPSTKKDYFPFY